MFELDKIIIYKFLIKNRVNKGYAIQFGITNKEIIETKIRVLNKKIRK